MTRKHRNTCIGVSEAFGPVRRSPLRALLLNGKFHTIPDFVQLSCTMCRYIPKTSPQYVVTTDEAVNAPMELETSEINAAMTVLVVHMPRWLWV